LTLKFSRNQATSPARFRLNLLKLLPKKRFTKHQREYYLQFGQYSYGDGNGEEQINNKRIAVCGGVTLEVCSVI